MSNTIPTNYWDRVLPLKQPNEYRRSAGTCPAGSPSRGALEHIPYHSVKGYLVCVQVPLWWCSTARPSLSLNTVLQVKYWVTHPCYLNCVWGWGTQLLSTYFLALENIYKDSHKLLIFVTYHDIKLSSCCNTEWLVLIFHYIVRPRSPSIRSYLLSRNHSCTSYQQFWHNFESLGPSNRSKLASFHSSNYLDEEI
jgi:hypothetical protein